MIRTDTPNDLQLVPLSLVEPHPDNVRLFIEKTSCERLEGIYRAYDKDKTTVLPDPPIVKYGGKRQGKHRFVLLAGERRVFSARIAGLKKLPMRVVSMEPEEEYKFILAHNDVEGLTTAELAFRAVEMQRLGFSVGEIERELGGVSLYRYLAVGSLINPDLFTDSKKLCDPSIIQWYEAAFTEARSPGHFERCFKHWDAGLWDEKQCAREFRRRGKTLPLDNAEKGFRVTFDQNRLVIRGQCDLDLIDSDVALDMLEELERHIDTARLLIHDVEDFGVRTVYNINPNTV